MRGSIFLLIVMFSLSSLSLAQTGYGGPPESENTRIAREHQPGGLYNPTSSNGGGSSAPISGAIALDTVGFSNFGSAYGKKGLQTVKDTALEFCGDNKKCEIVATYTRGSCGAIAITPKKFTPVFWSVEVKKSRRSAEKAALKSCNEKLKAAGINGVECENWSTGQCAVSGG